MSKKSREISSKIPAKSAAKTAAKPVAGKAAKPVAKPAPKAPAKKVAAKPVKPAAKVLAKVLAKTVTKAVTKTVTKTVAKVAAKPKPPAKAPKTVAAAKTPKPVPVTKPVAAPKPAKAKVDTTPALAVEGSKAPSFSLPRDGGATVSLGDYAGQKLVIFFYPRANTPGCTKEAIDFTRLSRDFSAAGTAVLGVSADPIKAQESFRDKHDLTTPLLSDETQSMLRAYGAWGEKSMYGKVFEGVLRTTVLIGSDGRVARIWRGVKVDGHADAVLERAREI